jgi:outer membrane protein insertion porin family
LKRLLSIILLSTVSNAAATKEIKLTGLTQISEKLAFERINSNKDDLNQVIKNFYKMGYFTNIDIVDENDTININFTEKPFIVNIEMEGYKTREEDLKELYKTMKIKKGSMFTEQRVQQAKAILLSELKKEGYINSVVEMEETLVNPQSMALKFMVNKGAEVVIKKINYTGAKELGKEQFVENTANKEEDTISWWFGHSDGVMQFSQLEYDHHRIKDIYLQNGFLDARVDAAFSKIDFNTNTAEIDFSIQEGPKYKVNNIIIYTDESIVPLDELTEGLREQKDKTFNIGLLRKDVEFLKTKIANKGYAFADVNYDIRKNKENQTADIIFNITPGEKVYINDVIIAGNTRTLDRVIRRNCYLAPKDLFNLTDFEDSRGALNRTGFFQTVDIKQKRVSNNLMDLVIEVAEAPTGNLVLGGGYGSYDGWMINASVNDKNIFGSGLDLGFSLDHSSKKDTAKISLNNPALNDGIYSGSFSVYKDTSIVTASIGSTTGDQQTDTLGGSLGVGRSIGRHTRVGTVYAIEKSDVTYDLNTTLNEIFTTSSITPYISFNNTDSFYTPRKGISANASLKYAGVGGDAHYLLNTNSLKYFYGFNDLLDFDMIFRYKTTLKILQDLGQIPDGTTFYLGGPTSVRGYQSYAFQPDDNANPYTKYLTNTAELSFPLIPKANMRWGLFYDYGMIGENSFNEIKKSGYGGLVEWQSPVGPLQFIFSRAINPTSTDKTSNFEFSLGTAF